MSETLKGQSSCPVVHVHSYSGGAGDRDIRHVLIVPESVNEWVAVQTPELIIPSKITLIFLSIPADAFV